MLRGLLYIYCFCSNQVLILMNLQYISFFPAANQIHLLGKLSTLHFSNISIVISTSNLPCLLKTKLVNIFY